jgi:hypothetical protein
LTNKSGSFSDEYRFRQISARLNGHASVTIYKSLLAATIQKLMLAAAGEYHRREH